MLPHAASDLGAPALPQNKTKISVSAEVCLHLMSVCEVLNCQGGGSSGGNG